MSKTSFAATQVRLVTVKFDPKIINQLRVNFA